MCAKFIEPVAFSAFSFKEGASMPRELISQAHALGLAGVGLADRDGVYGLVRAWKASREVGLQLLHGATLTMRDLPPLTLYAECSRGWANLCELITKLHADRPHGATREQRTPAGLRIDDIAAHGAGLVGLATWEWCERPGDLSNLSDALPLYALANRTLQTTDRKRVGDVEREARRLGLKVLASNRPLHHAPERQPLQDILTCLKHYCTIDEAGMLLQPNAERHLKPPQQVAALFRGRERWLTNTLELGERASFTLDQLTYSYPKEVVPPGETPMSWLRTLTERGLKRRYPEGTPAKVTAQVEHELGIIEELDFPAYFLTVEEIVTRARAREILCQGRGSAANSAVCFALGITSVDPARSTLLFERFISKERGEPPDIDIDFEHERREEVLQETYERYGRHRAAMVNAVVTYRPRSAVRDVGKAMGLSLDQIDRLAKGLERWSRGPIDRGRVREAGIDPDDPRVELTLDLAAELMGFPRHVSIHSGGFVIAEGSLPSRTPIEPASKDDRTVIQWDKDDIDPLGFIKIDLLALGILSAIRRCFDLVAGAHGHRWELATVPAEDPAVYDMLCEGDTVGVFQVESRAQMGMLPRMRPRCYYDLVIQISLVRPGPIQGGMVHPYLARRNGEEEVTYAHPDLIPILERTLGVPIFQEQVMAMAIAVGGFGAGEADQLRRAMGAWRRRGGLEPLLVRLRSNMEQRGISEEYCEQITKQIMGFGEYGFPESHASSFALIVYVSSWLKRYYPAAFAAALINSQPMGFYSVSTIVADAKRHGVEVRRVSIARSNWECTLEATGREDPTEGGRGGVTARGVAIRLGMACVKGLAEEDAAAIVEGRGDGYASITEVAAVSGVDKGPLRALARADAFADLGIDRREALWQIEGLWRGPLIAPIPLEEDGAVLPKASAWEQMSLDYGATGLSLRAHPISLLRPKLGRRVTTIAALEQTPPGSTVTLAVVVTHRQRPATASGVLFMGVEDETGMGNVVVWPKLYERHRKVIRGHQLLIITGRLQRSGTAPGDRSKERDGQPRRGSSPPPTTDDRKPEAISIVAFRIERPPRRAMTGTDGVRELLRSRDFR